MSRLPTTVLSPIYIYKPVTKVRPLKWVKCLKINFNNMKTRGGIYSDLLTSREVEGTGETVEGRCWWMGKGLVAKSRTGSGRNNSLLFGIFLSEVMKNVREKYRLNKETSVGKHQHRSIKG